MAGLDVRPLASTRPGLRRVWALAILAIAMTVAACGGTSPTNSVSATSKGRGPSTTVPSAPSTAPSPTGAPATLLGGAAPVPAPTGPTVSPPSTVAANCSVDVSKPLRKWLRSLPAGSTVVAPANACYLVDAGLRLNDPKKLTIYGGTFTDKATTGAGVHPFGDAVFSVIGGSDLTIEAMHIVGVNPGGYHRSLAFAAGIELEGTAGATIRGVTISNTFGDGITLDPLRGAADHESGQILAPASAVVIRDVTVKDVGRQGITFASIKRAQVSDVIVDNPGINTFDFEADQGNEGAKNVTIDGCEATAGHYFFANGGAGDGRQTGNITVERCTMETVEGGTAILVARARHDRVARGPFTFEDDSLRCGASVYVSCVQVTKGDVTVSNSSLRFPAATIHEPVYHAAAGAHVTFDNDEVSGYGHPGAKTGKKTIVRVVGGDWKSWADQSQ